MAKNILVISVDPRETRVALIENGVIAELHIERSGHAANTVGNVYLGKVTRVLPGLQAAFIEIGQERAAFLHVEDLIRPDDFDSYLAGGRKHARGEVVEGAVAAETEVDDEEGEEAAAAAPAVSPEDAHAAATEAVEAGDSGVDAGDTTGHDPHDDDISDEVPPAQESGLLINEEHHDPSSAPVIAHATSSTHGVSDVSGVLPPDSGPAASGAELDASDEDEEDDDADADSGEDVNDEGEGEDKLAPAPAAAAAPAKDADDDDDFGDLPGFTITDPNEPVPQVAARSADPNRSGGRRGRGRRGRGRRDGQSGGGGGGRDVGAQREGGSRGGGGGGGGRSRSGGGGRGGDRGGSSIPRISKTTPIRDVVKEGQEIIVQVTKDPIGTKGARCSSHISLPGRYVVFLPTVDHIGISKRIGSDKERARLREVIESVKPPTGGLIVRTVAEGLTKKQLKQDVGYLVRLWGEIAKKNESAHAPSLLSSELDIVLKVARDLFTDEVEEVVIDDKHQHERLCRFVEMFAPDRVKDVKLYTEDEPIFDEYGIEDEIGRALARKVPLPSGGHLIIDQAEALTAIDVNTGRFVGKGSKDMEETILKTNLEAVKEIAYQLRFRNIGGLIILDLIDMEKSANREKVRRTLDDLLQNDKAKTTLNRISDLGLIEMTRKRTRESLGRLLNEPCFYCDGTGQLQSKETIAYEILREIRRKRNDLAGYSVVVNAHPAVADVLNGAEREAVAQTESKTQRKIQVVPRREYHIEQFDLTGR